MIIIYLIFYYYICSRIYFALLARWANELAIGTESDLPVMMVPIMGELTAFAIMANIFYEYLLRIARNK